MDLAGKKILITGGTGLIGQELARQLREAGAEAGILGRGGKKDPESQFFVWNPANEMIHEEALEWADALVHLAGAGIADKKWTPERKKVLRDSRIASTRFLVNEIREKKHKLEAVICASAIGYYGFQTSDRVYTEEDESDASFLSQLCVDWETEAKGFQELGLRTAIIRVGVVLSTRSGALPQMALPVKFGVGSPIGNGRQWMNWIHLEDMAGMFKWALESDNASGIYNWVGPSPETNRDFTKKLAKALSRPMIAPAVPRFAVELLMGKDIAALALEGSPISSSKVTEAGFQFRHATLESALADLYR